jgi:glycosyltransferase involved in cell wall biosynthesis
MKICKIWDSEYPWDVRVQKIASALTNAGHEVHIVARNRKQMPLVEELPEGRVHRLAPLPLLGRRLSDASMFPAFFNPRWIGAIQRTARRTGADLILVRDLPLAPTAIWAGRRLRIPVVLDMAENYPAMMRSIWETGVHQPLDWLIRHPANVQRVERWVLRRIDHILVVVEESRDRLVSLGVPMERITVVSNTPPLARLQTHAAREHRDGPGPLEVVYLGLLEAPRGIGILIDALARCRELRLPVTLTLIGEGRERALFERQAARLGLGPGVLRFKGYLPNVEAVQLLQAADVGAVPHLANESWNTTIPNKLFDYMAGGLAVLTSDARPAARIVRETAAGEVYRDTDPVDLASAIARLADARHRACCGAAGREAVRATYHWERDAERLLGALEKARAGAP